MLNICTWLWGNKYNASYVNKLAAGVRRNLQQPHRFLLMTERERKDLELDSRIERHAIKDPDLLRYRGCFVRLRIFDPSWQASRSLDGPIVNLDLDIVITGELDALFDRPESFVILQGANSMNPCPFNGSVFMFKPGCHANLWTDYSPRAVSKIPKYSFPDDQGWFHAKVSNAGAWPVGSSSGIYAFRKPGWPQGDGLPADAKIVAFPGGNDPFSYQHLDWVKEHWR